MSAFFQVILVLILLAGIVMVLLAIRRLGHLEDWENADETILLKKEVEKNSNVMSENNAFHTLLESTNKKDWAKRDNRHIKKLKLKQKEIQKDISKDPSSRNEYNDR